MSKPLSVPDSPNCHRLVKEFYKLFIKEFPYSTLSVACRYANVPYETVRHWRYKSNPQIEKFEQVLNVLGYELAIVPKKKDKDNMTDEQRIENYKKQLRPSANINNP